MAIKTRSVDALFDSMDRRFPNRDRASDGWIGDAAHRRTRSGHNPDESGNAELSDSDNVDEVRAGDLDKDLRDPYGYTMNDVMEAIRTDPTDRARVYYLIWDGRQCSARTGWRWVPYYGDNDHSQHGHVSTLVAADNDGRPWLSVEGVGEEMTPDLDRRLKAIEAKLDTIPDSTVSTLLGDDPVAVIKSPSLGTKPFREYVKGGEGARRQLVDNPDVEAEGEPGEGVAVRVVRIEEGVDALLDRVPAPPDA